MNAVTPFPDEIDTTPLTELAEAVQEMAERIGLLQQQLAEPFASDESEAVATAIESLQELGGEVEEATSALNTQAERSQDLIAALQTDVGSESADVIEAGGDVRECLEAQQAELAAALAQARSSFANVMTDLAATMNDHQQETLAGLRSTLLDGVQRIFVTRIAGADAAQREQVEALNQEMGLALDLLLELLEYALQAVNDALQAALDGAEADRSATQPALDAVSAVLDPLLEQVDRVKSLASSVGIDI